MLAGHVLTLAVRSKRIDPLMPVSLFANIGFMSDWNKLKSIWQQVMSGALKAYFEGSVPIGAVVVDEQGVVVSRGRNKFTQDRIAHAETEALRTVPTNLNRKNATLYSSMEPCPMCTGAVRVMQLKAVRFAARDPAAGSLELLGATQFMRHFDCQVFEPNDLLLERVNVAMMMEFRTRNGHKRWRDSWFAYLPEAVEVGEALAASMAFDGLRQSTPQKTYDTIAANFP